MNIDSIFVNWNRATIQSLNQQIELANDSSLKALYKNRLEAFKAYLEIDSISTRVNAKSIRYQFLLKHKNKLENANDFYIVEANQLGEKVEIRNYVIYLKSKDWVDVYVYNFTNGEWIVNEVPKSIKMKLNDSLKTYLTEFKKGFNNDDVIITQIENSKVKESQYYLFTTLSNSNNFKALLLTK